MARNDLTQNSPSAGLSAEAFKSEMVAALPHVRAFARNLSQNREKGDDIVQEAMLKAWSARDRFTPGTSFKSWLFVIARNIYLSEMRRAKFQADYDPDLAEKLLQTPASQTDIIALGDVQRAMAQLPFNQREALVLVGAGQMPYEEAAEVCGCAVGTIKSRVSRARSTLEQILSRGQLGQTRGNSSPATSAFDNILSEVP